MDFVQFYVINKCQLFHYTTQSSKSKKEPFFPLDIEGMRTEPSQPLNFLDLFILHNRFFTLCAHFPFSHLFSGIRTNVYIIRCFFKMVYCGRMTASACFFIALSHYCDLELFIVAAKKITIRQLPDRAIFALVHREPFNALQHGKCS